MSDYKRLISYIYEYEGKTKGKNVGFVKLEARNGQCRLNVNVKKVYVGGNAVGVFLLGKERQETFLGNIFIRGGGGEFRAVVDAGNVEGTGNSLDTYYGLTIHDVRSSWRSYTTIWEDSVSHMAQDTLPGPGEKEADGERAVSKVVKEIEDEIAREEERKARAEKAAEEPAGGREESIAMAAQVGLAVKPEDDPGDMPEAEMRSGSGAPQPEQKEGCPEGTECEKPGMKNRPEGTDYAKPGMKNHPEEQKSGPVIVNFPGRAFPEPETQKADRQPAGSAGTAGTDRMPHGGAMAGLSFLSGFMNPLSGQAPFRGPAVPAAKEPVTASGETGAPVPGAESTGVVRSAAGAPVQPGAAVQKGVSMQPGAAVQKGVSMQPGAAVQKGVSVQPEPAFRKEAAAEENERGRTGTERTGAGPEKGAGGKAAGEEDPGQKEETVAPGLENEAVLRYLRETEETGGDPEKLWQELRRSYPKIQPFDYDEGCEILTVRPQDIGRLPREAWVYGNNSFLLHGYYSFRYLILVRLGNSRGNPRYLLGVPGHYYSNEKYMAAMFGFPNFVLSKKQPPNDGRFGYWYTDIRMG